MAGLQNKDGRTANVTVNKIFMKRWKNKAIRCCFVMSLKEKACNFLYSLHISIKSK